MREVRVWLCRVGEKGRMARLSHLPTTPVVCSGPGPLSPIRPILRPVPVVPIVSVAYPWRSLPVREIGRPCRVARIGKRVGLCSLAHVGGMCRCRGIGKGGTGEWAVGNVQMPLIPIPDP